MCVRSYSFLLPSKPYGIYVLCYSNADERYGDSILPMLGVTFDVLHFACFSKDYGLEKPDARIFMSALKEAEGWIFNTEDPLLPGHCLHIGNGTLHYLLLFFFLAL
jgi:FMN phosphatase YigB (HAD superfamily)